MTFNVLRGLDADLANWKQFRHIFCSEQSLRQPIWDTTVTYDTPLEFVDVLSSISVILTYMNENIFTDTMLPDRAPTYPTADIQNYQNVIQHYLNPQTLYASLQLTYSYWYNDQVHAFQRRRVTDYHPLGPSGESNVRSSDNELGSFISRILLSTDDDNLTLREAWMQVSMDWFTEDEQLALALEVSRLNSYV